MKHLDDLATPCLLLDVERFQRNVSAMREEVRRKGAVFRPHVKTAKSVEVTARLFDGQPGPITVSTLQEAEYFAQAGYSDILYAVALGPSKLPRAAALVRAGVDLTVILDSRSTADTLADFCTSERVRIAALIEIDTDGHRAGLRPDDPALLDVARTLHGRGLLKGLMAHAGSSYSASCREDICAIAERERSDVLEAADRLRAHGISVEILSIGSTPTARFGQSADGITEIRAGVFMFYDLVMAGINVCTTDDIAVSVLVTVIGHQLSRNALITDGGWMALSRDRGTSAQRIDFGYGLVCDVAGKPVSDLIVTETSQEHGTVSSRSGEPVRFDAFPIGQQLRILPNHACATSAQHSHYHVINADGSVIGKWPRMAGWG